MGEVSIQAMLQSQSDTIWTLAIVLSILFILAVWFFIMWMIRRHYKNTLRVGIHMPNSHIIWYTIKKGLALIRIDHGRLPNGNRDVFTYLYDQDAVSFAKRAQIERIRSATGPIVYKLTVRDENSKGQGTIEFYYRNPNPIVFDTNDVYNIATVKQQNLNLALESDLAEKLISSRGILKTLIPLAFFTLGICGLILLVSGYGTFAGSGMCTLKMDNQTINVIDYAVHRSAPASTPVQAASTPSRVVTPPVVRK
jgi:hypothetical protein